MIKNQRPRNELHFFYFSSTTDSHKVLVKNKNSGYGFREGIEL